MLKSLIDSAQINISSLFFISTSKISFTVVTLHIFPRSCTCLNNDIIPNNLLIQQLYINHQLMSNKFQTETEAWDDFFHFVWNFCHGTEDYSHMVLQLPIKACY